MSEQTSHGTGIHLLTFLLVDVCRHRATGWSLPQFMVQAASLGSHRTSDGWFCFWSMIWRWCFLRCHQRRSLLRNVGFKKQAQLVNRSDHASLGLYHVYSDSPHKSLSIRHGFCHYAQWPHISRSCFIDHKHDVTDFYISMWLQPFLSWLQILSHQPTQKTKLARYLACFQRLLAYWLRLRHPSTTGGRLVLDFNNSRWLWVLTLLGH